MWIRRSKYRKIMSDLTDLKRKVSDIMEQQELFSNGETCGRGSLDYIEGVFPSIEATLDSNSRGLIALRKELNTIITKINEYVE